MVKSFCTQQVFTIFSICFVNFTGMQQEIDAKHTFRFQDKLDKKGQGEAVN